MSSSSVIPAPRVLETVDRLKSNIERTIRGKSDAVDRVIICLLAGGHVLIEDLPGLGKTTLAYSLARSVDCSFSRIQFTSDLLPSDIIGVSIYDERTKEFTFKRGPIFANVVLADEINRTTPKTQSSLLEVMGRGKLSVDGQTYTVPPPFMVIATQNPVDFEGTFPLPESQMDRFLMRMEMGYPEFEYELDILNAGRLHYDHIDTDPVVSRAEISEMQEYVRSVFVEETVAEYIVRIAHATRELRTLRSGISPRGTLALKVAAQARALSCGRAFVLPEDVREMAVPVLAHRLSLRSQQIDPIEERRTVEGVLMELLDGLREPS
ncbi:AAA family ATPase [Coraliomargarita akajimensis]|uniref:ATPase associated with various cellular activities AAA_3 n=1 Tax=Coraliomargarita akajimensis (strain DSM 45221 / IAM 15411 / JCM 23193 / KCTC 12865 / 04OKA010-24) TaxID=583355 RepID=D5EJQ3_CORAD|nr:MoxR family ATPase [Coraliomargarita akajimensis]ADE54652.1 ATPase associated with various cellular activities AAA_3 [Coraliomargarita akajimensis DSM 45221]